MDTLLLIKLYIFLSMNIVVSSSPTQDSRSDSYTEEDEPNVVYLDDGEDEYDSSSDGPPRTNSSKKPEDMMMMSPMMPPLGMMCFPASATVSLDNGKTIPITQLKEGQKVLTANSDGEIVYSQVVTFLKRIARVISPYIVLETKGASLALSRSHVIFLANDNSSNFQSSKFAKDVKIGDLILVKSENNLKPQTVVHVHEMDMEGAYVPLTEHGTILVDNVLASCYASFDHWVAHFFLAPLRWWPSLFGAMRTEDDMPAYVYAAKEIGHFMLPYGLQNRLNWASALFTSS